MSAHIFDYLILMSGSLDRYSAISKHATWLYFRNVPGANNTPTDKPIHSDFRNLPATLLSLC